jgi:hypothetical protein
MKSVTEFASTATAGYPPTVFRNAAKSLSKSSADS